MFWYVLGIAAAVITWFGFVPQIVKGYKTKKLDDLAYGMMILLSVGMSLWLIYGVHLHDPIIIGANVLGVASSILLLVMKWKYSKK